MRGLRGGGGWLGRRRVGFADDALHVEQRSRAVGREQWRQLEDRAAVDKGDDRVLHADALANDGLKAVHDGAAAAGGDVGGLAVEAGGLAAVADRFRGGL